jgi:[CysO sulfur-carrier protein]-S-L-cysteine hydrolase
VSEVIELPRSMFDEIVAHAEAELPNEACGVIAGENGRPVRHYRMRNAEESPALYRFDPKEHLDVLTEIEEQGWDALAFWHSHTHTEAYPSPTDRDEAHWPDPVEGGQVPRYPGTLYLVLSLQDREHPAMRGFRFEGGEPLEEEVRIA